jgi:hypothetical protein
MSSSQRGGSTAVLRDEIFVFEAVPQLYAFLSHFTHRLPLVQKLGVASMSARTGGAVTHIESRLFIAHMTLGHIFPLFTQATSLEALYMNTSIYQSFSSKASLAAKNFYDKTNSWLWAMVLHKRDPSKILQMPKSKMKGLNGQYWKNKQWSTSRKGQDEFLAELGARLVVPARVIV